MCHGVVLQKRHDQLKGLLDPKFHVLLEPSNSVTLELLIDNVDQKVAESTKLVEAAQKLQLKRPYPFHANSNFQRGTAYHANSGRWPFTSRGRR